LINWENKVVDWQRPSKLQWKNGITSIIRGAALALHVWLTGRFAHLFSAGRWRNGNLHFREML